MMQTNTNISVEELIKHLEPLIRRIIREELTLLTDKKNGIFCLEPDSPLYDDMLDIKNRKDKGELELFSHNEVWDG